MTEEVGQCQGPLRITRKRVAAALLTKLTARTASGAVLSL